MFECLNNLNYLQLIKLKNQNTNFLKMKKTQTLEYIAEAQSQQQNRFADDEIIEIDSTDQNSIFFYSI